jgi:DNA-binding LacI/PurR family transcriptional regulator
MAPRDPERRKGRATSYDVAKLAGVSQSAVSRVFTPGASVAQETRDKVMEAARALGYRPNAIARGLIKGRSNLVGLILPSSASFYYPEITIDITAATAEHGARVLLIPVDTAEEVSAAIEQLWSFRVDGVIVASALTAAQLEEFELHRTPVIFYNRPPPHHAGNSVGVDHAEAESRLVDRLWAAGHRRFALITGPEGSDVAQARARGAVERLKTLGADLRCVAKGDYRYDSGVEAFTAIRKVCGDALDVVLCANDAMALGAMDAARLRHGLKVPEQISIVGFDGFSAGRWLAYQLTTVRQPMAAMAKAAVEMLFARIEDPDLESERRLFSCEIVPGRSARLGQRGEVA